jgi:hypothetical protein
MGEPFIALGLGKFVSATTAYLGPINQSYVPLDGCSWYITKFLSHLGSER